MPDTVRPGGLRLKGAWKGDGDDDGDGDTASTDSSPDFPLSIGLRDGEPDRCGRYHGAPVFGWVARPKGIWKKLGSRIPVRRHNRGGDVNATAVDAFSFAGVSWDIEGDNTIWIFLEL